MNQYESPKLLASFNILKFYGGTTQHGCKKTERVSKAFQNNIWIKPTLDLDIGERLPEI